MARKKEQKDKKKNNKNRSGFLKFLGNIFFEEIDKSEDGKKAVEGQMVESDKEQEDTTQPISKNENEKILQEMYGNSEGEETEEKKKKDAKAAKKAAAKAKKEEAKAKKAAAKAKKAAAKPVKVKKPKEPPKPEDLIKLRPVPIFLLLLFIVGVVVLVNMGNTAFYYYNDVRKANESFQNGDYRAAYEAIQGITPREGDQRLQNQILTVMYVEKQLQSYQNYMKMGKGTEAIDSLIKGIQSYQNYYDMAKELDVTEQFDKIKSEIIDALNTTFAVSEDKAISYVSLSKEDFTQYYRTLENYGGMVQR